MKHRTGNRRLVCLLLVLVLCAALLSIAAFAEGEAEEGDITSMSVFLASNRRATLESVTDESTKTKLSLAANDWFSLQWKGTVSAQGLYLVWNSVPETYIVEQRDRSGSTLWTATINGGSPQQYVTLDERCGMVLVLASGKGELARVCLCRADTELPQYVHNWSDPGKADLMLFAAKAGDETEIFPGILETYAVERGMSCVLVYLSTPEKTADRIALLDRLWALGVRTLPVFGAYDALAGIPVSAVEGYQTSEEYALTFAVETVRRYQPLVLVSHAEGGEDGDSVRAVAYRVARQAASLAADINLYADSMAEYGAWRVQKLYLHDFTQNTITFSGEQYGLVSSQVGADSVQEDLFENIAESELSGYVPPEETPAPTGTAAPYAPTPSPAPAEESEYDAMLRSVNYAWYALLALLAVILVLMIVLIVRVTREWRRNGVPVFQWKKHDRAADPEDAERKEQGKDE